jgi:hypothetical protein
MLVYSHPRCSVGDALSGGLVGSEGDLVCLSSWSLHVLRLLGDQGDASLVTLSWNNSHGLSIMISSHLKYPLNAHIPHTLSLTNPACCILVSIRLSITIPAATYLARVDVGQVESVAREADTSIGIALDEVRVLVSWEQHISLIISPTTAQFSCSLPGHIRKEHIRAISQIRSADT